MSKKRTPSSGMNFFYSTVTLIINAIVPLITYPYITRTLMPEYVGRFNFAYAIALLFLTMIQFGLPYYGAREIAKVKDDKEALQQRASEIFTMNLIIGAIFSLVYILLIIFVDRINQDAVLFINIGFMVYLVPLMLNWFFQGIGDFRYIALRNAAFRLIAIGLMFIFIKEPAHYVRYGWIMAFSFCGHFLINYLYANKYIPLKLTLKSFKTHSISAFYCTPLMIVNLASVQIGSIMLGFLSDDFDVAYYSIPAQIITTLTGVITALSFVMVPRMAEHLKEADDKDYRHAFKVALRVSWLIAVPLTIGLILTAKEIVLIFAGNDFYPAIQPLQLGALRILIVAVSGFTGAQVLMANGEEKKLFTSIIAGIVCMVLADIVLIPAYGSNGAMIGMVLSEVVVLGLQMMLGKRYYNMKMIFNMDALKYLLISLSFIPVCLLLKQIGAGIFVTLLLCVVGCIMIYFSALAAFKDPIVIGLLRKTISVVSRSGDGKR